MRHQMEDSGRKSCHPAGHEHVAKLRNGGIRKDLFDIRLSDSDRGSKKGGQVPMIATTVNAIGARSKITCERATMYTPAVTMVAAWIKAETGVGPSIASGSHT